MEEEIWMRMSDLSDYHRLYDNRIYYPLLYRTIVSYQEMIYNPVPDLTLTGILADSIQPYTANSPLKPKA